MSAFKIKIRALRSKSQTLGGGRHSLFVLPACRLRFGKLQRSLDAGWIGRELLARVDNILIIRKRIELAPQTGRNFESARAGLGIRLRLKAEGSSKEKHYKEDSGFPPPQDTALSSAHLRGPPK